MNHKLPEVVGQLSRWLRYYEEDVREIEEYNAINSSLPKMENAYKKFSEFYFAMYTSTSDRRDS
jgi:hypothetical protein